MLSEENNKKYKNRNKFHGDVLLIELAKLSWFMKNEFMGDVVVQQIKLLLAMAASYTGVLHQAPANVNIPGKAEDDGQNT